MIAGWESVETDASRYYKINRSGITNVVLGKRTRVGGRQFEFYGEI